MHVRATPKNGGFGLFLDEDGKEIGEIEDFLPVGITPEEVIDLCEEDPDKADRMMFRGDRDE